MQNMEDKKCWQCKYCMQDFSLEYQCTREKEYPDGKDVDGDSDACEYFAE